MVGYKEIRNILKSYKNYSLYWYYS